MTKHLALHETLEVHELLTFKNLSLTKCVTMSGLVQDENLKSILLEDAASCTQFIKQMKEFLTDRSQH